MKISKGRILYVRENLVLKSIGYKIYISLNSGESWQHYVSIKVCLHLVLFSKISIIRRLLRLGIYKVIAYENKYVIFCDKTIYLLDSNSKINQIGQVHGSRPLYVCSIKNKLYYGQYFSNTNRLPVKIYCYDFVSRDWSIVHEMQNIRHVHGIFYDHFTDSIWVTTGDLDHESALWVTKDEFKTMFAFLQGTQQYRTIYLHFAEDYIEFGTDAPNDQNFIYRVSRKSKEVLSKTPINGPVFYGCSSGNRKFLSTVVEPSTCNKTKFAEVWCSDGNDWYLTKKFKKDYFPKKIFQYGQLYFPEGVGDGMYMWLTPAACKLDNRVIRISIPHDFNT